jgi:hypothetical protein
MSFIFPKYFYLFLILALSSAFIMSALTWLLALRASLEFLSSS